MRREQHERDEKEQQQFMKQTNELIPEFRIQPLHFLSTRSSPVESLIMVSPDDTVNHVSSFFLPSKVTSMSFFPGKLASLPFTDNDANLLSLQYSFPDYKGNDPDNLNIQ
jgi:hypothetical protein